MLHYLPEEQSLLFSGPFGNLRWKMPDFPLASGDRQTWKMTGCELEMADGCLAGFLTFADEKTEGAVSLRMETRLYPDLAIARLRYHLSGPSVFPGRDGTCPIRYGRIPIRLHGVTEVQLGQFDRILHSFVPQEIRYGEESLPLSLAGPILAAEGEDGAFLLAYEHGAQQPDHYLEIGAGEDGLSLYSVKGNYYRGQEAGEYLAPWIQLGTAPDLPSLRSAYRKMLLHAIAPGSESRKPYVFYNTWHFQEGRKYTLGHPFLTDMNEDYILKDIDRAHAIGVEVYVLDTGWYGKTGEWSVSPDRFPSGLRNIKERLDAYGMKLGLWFNPVAVAQSSAIVQAHPEYIIEKNGEKRFLGKIWETEESWGVCLDSAYGDWFAEQLIRLNRELGVTYFKWDAVDQYGCNAPGHGHGTQANDAGERHEVYAYRMALQMIRVVEKVTAACPEAIVDFDVTEGGRCFGLGFLSVGKFFLINNGPYYRNFDIPESYRRDPDTINVFFFPGSARAQICRQAVRYDAWIPSILFLTHFLPHGDARSDRNNQAAMILGGNGIWGYLDQMEPEGVERWKNFLALYKQVRNEITEAEPVRRGSIGASPEIIEKIHNGAGCICLFTHAPGEFTYKTHNPSAGRAVGADACTRLPNGTWEITVRLEEDDARTVFFLPEQDS